MDDETSVGEPSRVGTETKTGRARGGSKRVAILIAGMHRSGTSALARVLSLLGCDLPKTLLPAGPGNEPGHWESLPILTLNDDALASAGSGWDDWEPLNPSWYSSPARDRFLERALVALESEFGDSRMFVLKDPRICRLLGFWIEAIGAFGALPVIVSPIRNPLEVAASLEKRDGIDPSIGQLLWLRHVLGAEKDSRRVTRAFIRYDQLLAGARVHTLTQRLGDELQLSWPRRSTAVDVEIEQFLSPAHRHNVEEDANVLSNPSLSNWIRSSFDILDRWARGEIYDADSAKLDDVRAAFDQAAPAFARPVLVGRQVARRSTALQAELAAAGEQYANLEGMLAARQAELVESKARLGDLEHAVAAKETELAQRETELAEGKALLGDLEAALAAKETELSQREIELAESKARLGDLDGALAVREAELAEGKARLGDLEGALTARDAELTESKVRVGDLEGALAARETDLAESQTRATELDQARSEKEGEVGRLQRTAVERDAHMAALETTVAELRASTSWQLTAPLRKAGLALKRARYSAAGFPVMLGLRALMTFSRAPLRDLRAARVIARSDLFDRDWYHKSYPDVAALGIDPVRHYVAFGASEGRDPGPLFSPARYLSVNPDVAQAGVNPLGHYLSCGAREGRSGGPRRLADGSARALAAEEPIFLDRYSAWMRVNTLTQAARLALTALLAAQRDRVPLISVIMPVYNAPAGLIDRAIRSVVDQIYQQWELCIADDASTDPEIARTLIRWSQQDPRIKLVRRANNGNISRATNSAAKQATGEFLAFLDHDDELTVDALAEVALAAADNPEMDYLYSDDDKMDLEGNRFAPQFKPDWSPVLLLSYMYMGHIKVVRRSLFEELGGFRAGFEGAQDYDFVLRMADRVRTVVHIPKVLYHWRTVPGSTAASGDEKPRSFDAGARAVAEAYERRGIAASVRRPSWAVEAGVGIFESRFPHTGPSVAIIIPTRNGLDMLRACLASLKKTLYDNYEIVIVDNESDDPDTLAYLSSLPHRVLRIANPPTGRFNFAHLNNEAVRQVGADYVLLLNNDTELRTPEWLSQMMGYARMDKVGAVGARLLFPDETVQHAGVVHGYFNGLVGHAFRNTHALDHGYMSFSAVAREYSAVTAACLLTRRALFLEMGGLDEQDFGVAYNDVDFCYRLVDAGWTCVYCPTAVLVHHEGKSRGFNDDPREIAALRRKYASRVDPWYNGNLSLDDEHFQVKPYHMPSRLVRPIRVAMISHNLNHEGAPICMLELVLGLKRKGIVDPIVIAPVDGPLRHEYERAGLPVRFVRSPVLDAHDTPSFVENLNGLACLFEETESEIVYGNTAVCFWAIAAGARAGLPTIWNFRESEPWQTYFDYLPAEVREQALASFARPYQIIFVSNATRSSWAPLNSSHNYAVIHDGIDRTRFAVLRSECARRDARRELGIGDNEIAALLVGTVCERKGQLDAVKSLVHVSRRTAERLRLFIVGDRPGEYSNALHAEIGRFLPSVRDRIVVQKDTDADAVLKYYEAADVSLCTSRIESYPRVILEAMASGLPIITTPVFGVREQVRDGVNALLYEPGDAVMLADRLDRVALEDSLRGRLAANSMAVLDSLSSFEEMLEAYGRVFRQTHLSGTSPTG